MIIKVVDKLNTTLIGQDKETLTLKALLYFNGTVYSQVCRILCVVRIPLFTLVQLGYPDMTNISVVKHIIRYKGVFAITNTPRLVLKQGTGNGGTGNKERRNGQRATGNRESLK